MGEITAISWTDHTFNPWIGCTKVSPGCANCYAATQDKLRAWTPEGWGAGKPRKRTAESNWKQPLKWDRSDERKRVSALHSWPAGQPMPWTRPRVFCASLADWLDDEVPIEWLADLLDLIRRTPNLDWLLLTKRPENFRKQLEAVLGIIPRTGLSFEHAALRTRIEIMLRGWGGEIYIAPEVGIQNYWIGTTVENQAMADKRIPELLEIPAKVRFLSCEPLLEAVDLMWPESLFPDGPTRCCGGHQCGCHGQPAEPPMIYGIHWIITGGESGPNFRPFDPDWARSLRDQCKAANVAFHMKQMGGLRPSSMPPIPQDIQIREFPTP